MNGRYPKPDQPVRQESNDARTTSSKFAYKNLEPMRAHSGYAKPAEAEEHSNSSAREGFDWYPTRKKFSERLCSFCNWLCRFSLALGRGIRQIPNAFVKSYFAVRALPTWRQINVFFLMPLIFYSLTFHSVDWWFKEPPQDLFAAAQASEHIPITNIHDKGDLGEFIEDCY